MNAHIRRLTLVTVLILAAACAPRSEEGADAAETPVDRAVAAAHAIQTNYAAADSILAAYRLTRAGFDSLLYAIAADSALARAYTEAMR